MEGVGGKGAGGRICGKGGAGNKGAAGTDFVSDAKKTNIHTLNEAKNHAALFIHLPFFELYVFMRIDKFID